MPDFLPGNLACLFVPRLPLPFAPALHPVLNHEKGYLVTGVVEFMRSFEAPRREDDGDGPVDASAKAAANWKTIRKERAALELERQAAEWKPKENEKATLNPYRTAFVGRLSYDTTEARLLREFEVFGTVKSVEIVKDVSTGKPKGYAFVQFKHESDMMSACRKGDGMKIDGRRIVVDVQRAVTVKNWKPRRLGGGLGVARDGAKPPGNRESQFARFDSQVVRSQDRRGGSRSNDRRGDNRRGDNRRDDNMRSDNRRDDSRRGDNRRGRDRDSRDDRGTHSRRDNRAPSPRGPRVKRSGSPNGYDGQPPSKTIKRER